MTTHEQPIGRRTAIKMGLAATAAGALPARRARAQTPKEVKIALVVPLSGPVGAPGHPGADGRRDGRSRT